MGCSSSVTTRRSTCDVTYYTTIPLSEGTQRIIFSYIHQNVYSEVPSKERRKAIASKFTISYQNKDFKKSKAYEVILSQIREQRLNLDTAASIDIFANIILGQNNHFEKKTLFCSEKVASKEELLQE